MNGAYTRISITRRRTRCTSASSPHQRWRQRDGHERQLSRNLDFRGCQSSGYLEISAPAAFTVVGFFGQRKKPGASAAERGRPRESKTIDEDQRWRDDHYPPPRQIHLS